MSKPQQHESNIIRSAVEVQRAHDVLGAIVTGLVDIGCNQNEKRIWAQAMGVLCWALGHEHNTAFEDALAELEGEIARRGYSFVELPELMTQEDAARYVARPAVRKVN